MKIIGPISNWMPELKNLKVETAAGDVAPVRAVTLQDRMRHTAGRVYETPAAHDALKNCSKILC